MRLSIALNYYLGRFIGIHKEKQIYCRMASILSLIFNSV